MKSEFNKDFEVFLAWWQKNWKNRCRGRQSELAYQCCLEKGHEGDCFSKQNHVSFKPEDYDSQISFGE